MLLLFQVGDPNPSKEVEEGLPRSSKHSGVSSDSTNFHVKTHSKSTEEASRTDIPSAGGGSGSCGGGGGGSGGADNDSGGGGGSSGGGGGDDGSSGGGSGSLGGSSMGELSGVKDNDSCYSVAPLLRDICPRALDGDGARVDPPDHAATVGEVRRRPQLFLLPFFPSDSV